MNQEEFGKFIKDIRKKNNLTQKDLADKYNVTYQAVSKWENGINMPDTILLKQIAKDFNVSLDEILNGTTDKKNNKKLIIIIISILVVLLIILSLILFPRDKKGDFNFKVLSTECNNFNVAGSISYNDNKSAICISNIEYSGNDKENYKEIECTLYEKNGDTNTKISTCNYNGESNLENFLKDVTFTIDNYSKVCKEYDEDSLYLEIKAKDNNDKTTSYKVPLQLNNCLN